MPSTVTCCALATLLLGTASCGLLEPYPNGENPADQLLDPTKGQSGISSGSVQEPLVNPPTDTTVTVANLLDGTVESTMNGGTFNVRLNYIAPGKNVVGGGISLADSDEVQWTFLEGLKGTGAGEIAFAFSVGENVCADVPPLCHAITTQQFAVSQDVNGVYMVSKPVEVTIVLQCASCESESCNDLLGPGQCRACEQPDSCAALWATCYGPTGSAAGTSEADVYQAFFAERGVMWTGAQTCLSGGALCEQIANQGNCKFPKTGYFGAANPISIDGEGAQP